jgi:hypothetical protein
MIQLPARLTRATLGGTLARVGALGVGSTEAENLTANAARTVTLSDAEHLRLTSKRGFVLNEQGAAKGTIKRTIYIHMRLVSNSRVTAEVNIYPSDGSLSGEASASYRVNGGYASFSDSLSISRGTGSHAHAHASGLRFTGTIQRRNDAVAAQLNGPLSV